MTKGGRVEAESSVHGVVRGESMTVAGTIIGQVMVTRLVIEAGGRVHGQVRAHHAEVYGRLHGQLEVESLVVHPEGQVDAELKAVDVLVEGTVSGRVVAERRIELKSTAVAHCELQAPELLVARGAQLRAGVGTSALAEEPAQTRIESDPSIVPHPELASDRPQGPTPSAVPGPQAGSASQPPTRRRRILVRKRR